MKVGILTFHFVYNYGAMLQAYALCSYINTLEGVEGEIIDYRSRKINSLYRPKFKDFCESPTIVIKQYIRRIISGSKYNGFEEFSRDHLNMSKMVDNDIDFEALLKNYDVVFVGSDQVWNPEITGYDKNYLLYKSSNSIKKISYAASFGTSEVDEYWKDSITSFLVNFRKISVREESGKMLINSILPNLYIEKVADPVFLLQNIEWKKLEKKVYGVTPYILFYSLNSGCGKELEEETLQISKCLNLKIISLHPMYKSKIGKSLCNIGPTQFLWLIDNATYVCTDSFHATAFSVIFRKNLIVKFDGEKGNRIKSLLNDIGCEVQSDLKSLGKYKFENLDNKVHELRIKGKKFIENSIGEDR